MKTLGFNSVVIADFMTNGLHLQGNELIIYAVIYNFSQDGEFHSVRINYLQNWADLTHQGITWIIGDLKKKGLIEIEKRGKINWYRIIQAPIEEYAKKVATEAKEKEKNRKKLPSPWEKALEKANAEVSTNNQPEDLKKLGEQIKSFDPYADDEE